MSLTEADIQTITEIVQEQIKKHNQAQTRNLIRFMNDNFITRPEAEARDRQMATKDELFTKLDQLFGQSQETRTETTMLSHRVQDHEKRITALEEETTS